MKLVQVLVRFYKSFNYDYERKANPKATPRSWEMTHEGWIGFNEGYSSPEDYFCRPLNQADITGSIVTCGREPWPPLPMKVICSPSAVELMTPGL